MLRDGLNDAFSGEHSGWHTEDLVAKLPDHARASRTAGPRARSSVSRRRRRPASSTPRSSRVEIKGRKGPELFDQRRAQPPRHDARDAGQAEARLPQGRHDHRRQRAGPQQRRRRDDRRRARLRRGARAWSRWRGSSATASPRSSPACSASGRCPAVRTGARARRLEARRHRAHRDQRGLRRHRRSRCMRELGLAEDIVNVEGGAIAHGHPIGATGAVLDDAASAFDAARRPEARRRHALHRRRAGHRARAGSRVRPVPYMRRGLSSGFCWLRHCRRRGLDFVIVCLAERSAKGLSSQGCANAHRLRRRSCRPSLSWRSFRAQSPSSNRWRAAAFGRLSHLLRDPEMSGSDCRRAKAFPGDAGDSQALAGGHGLAASLGWGFALALRASPS